VAKNPVPKSVPSHADAAQAIVLERSDMAHVAAPYSSGNLPVSGPATSSVSIGRIEVIFEAPRPSISSPTPRTNPGPPRTYGFDVFATRRLGRRR
jgi:hypothetical protein